MSTILDMLLPPRADGTLRGSWIPFWALSAVASIGVVRSCIHMLAPDGGARSIAGIDFPAAAASSVTLAFALWGSAQLVYALLQWVVLLRYRSLVPLMWCVQLVETTLRVLVGHLKPASFSHTPPGAVGNWVYAPLALVMLAVSIWTAPRDRAALPPPSGRVRER